MRFSTITVAAFAGLAIAAPLVDEPLEERGNKLGVHQIENRKALEKRFAWSAFGFGALSLWAIKEVGLFDRDLNSVYSKPRSQWSWFEVGEVLADSAVKFLSQSAKPNEATICADVPYTVDNDTLARKIGGFFVEGVDRNSTYDCFTLAGPNRFAVDLTQANATADSVAVIAGPGQWNETSGLLIL